MATPPFLKSNRVEDLREVIRRIYEDMPKGTSTSTTVASSSRTSIIGNQIVQVSGQAGKAGESVRGDKGDKGDKGDPGKDGVDGKDGAAAGLILARDHAQTPLLTRTGDIVCNHLGYLVLSRVRDLGVLTNRNREPLEE